MKTIMLMLMVSTLPLTITASSLYPFEVSYFHVKAQGENLNMAYMDVTAIRPNGKTVVLLHGKNFNGAYWEQTARELCSKGYRVIIPDQVGFGRSTLPQHLQYSFQLLASNTKMLLDSLDIKKFYLAGHSMGGMLATRFALMYPGAVEKLVLVNPIGLEDWKTVVPYQTVEDWYKQELDQTYEKMKAYQLKNYYHNEWRPAYDKWLDMQAALLKRSNYAHIAWNSAMVYDMIYTQPVCYEFQYISCPVLLIIGQKDHTALGKDKAPEELQHTLGNYPLLGKITAQKIRNAELVEIEEAGHLPHIETFEAFIKPVLMFFDEKN